MQNSDSGAPHSGAPQGLATRALLRLRVGELAKKTGKSVRALHLYEERGLLEPATRSKGGYRLYGTEAVTRVEWISKLQGIGFSLPAIREVLGQWKGSESAPIAMRRVTELYREKLAETEAEIRRLGELREELVASLGYLETCESCDDEEEAVAACASCERHECEEHPPVLVAGFHGP